MDANYTGNEIAKRRKALGLTQKQLAEKLHVTDKAVSKWERGLNFPDLGLIENLAAALEASPAQLLGLESAGQEEIVSSMTQLSKEQLESAQKQLRLLGWLAIGLAVVLGFVDRWIKWDSVRAYQTLMTLMWVLSIGGIWLLFRHGQIRKWNTGDWLCCYLAVFPVILYNLGYLFFDRGFPNAVESLFVLSAACGVQLLCYRVMQGAVFKALPLILLPVYLLLVPGNLDTGLCGIVFLITYLLCRRFDKDAQPIPIKRAAAMLLTALLVFCLLFSDSLIRSYVQIFHSSLETYATALLASSKTEDRYGPWEVHVYPEDGMVEFHTGGFGLVPSSTYEGFYYSVDDTHIPFQGVDVPMEDWGDTARWSDGTDNHGTSQRIRDNFFWFEASF